MGEAGTGGERFGAGVGGGGYRGSGEDGAGEGGVDLEAVDVGAGAGSVFARGSEGKAGVGDGGGHD